MVIVKDITQILMVHTVFFEWSEEGYRPKGRPHFVPVHPDANWYVPYWMLHDAMEHWPHGVIDFEDPSIINECIAWGACIYVGEILTQRTSGTPETAAYGMLEDFRRHSEQSGIPDRLWEEGPDPGSQVLMEINKRCPEDLRPILGWCNLGYRLTKEKISQIEVLKVFVGILENYQKKESFTINFNIK